MPSFICKKQLVFRSDKNKQLVFKPRSAGRIKTLASYTDLRAWSLQCDDNRQYFFDIINNCGLPVLEDRPSVSGKKCRKVASVCPKKSGKASACDDENKKKEVSCDKMPEPEKKGCETEKPICDENFEIIEPVSVSDLDLEEIKPCFDPKPEKGESTNKCEQKNKKEEPAVAESKSKKEGLINKIKGKKEEPALEVKDKKKGSIWKKEKEENPAKREKSERVLDPKRPKEEPDIKKTDDSKLDTCDCPEDKNEGDVLEEALQILESANQLLTDSFRSISRLSQNTINNSIKSERLIAIQETDHNASTKAYICPIKYSSFNRNVKEPSSISNSKSFSNSCSNSNSDSKTNSNNQKSAVSKRNSLMTRIALLQNEMDSQQKEAQVKSKFT